MFWEDNGEATRGRQKQRIYFFWVQWFVFFFLVGDKLERRGVNCTQVIDLFDTGPDARTTYRTSGPRKIDLGGSDRRRRTRGKGDVTCVEQEHVGVVSPQFQPFANRRENILMYSNERLSIACCVRNEAQVNV